jgi:DNA-binding Lrp family transcriptional regulator
MPAPEALVTVFRAFLRKTARAPCALTEELACKARRPLFLKALQMQRVKLDEIDWRILAELQADGRMTNVELASRVGISPPPCLRRVRALEEAGVIRGYRAMLDAKALGFDVTVFALVGLASQAEADLKAFERAVAGWPLVRECHMLNGEIDFILKIVTRDLDEFQSFLTEKLTAAPNVASVKTSLTIRSAKTEPGVPVALHEAGTRH